MAESVVNFRVSDELKKSFELVAKSRDLTASQMLRAYMKFEVERFLKTNNQRDLLKR